MRGAIYTAELRACTPPAGTHPHPALIAKPLYKPKPDRASIREQQYAVSASFIMNGNGIKFHRAAALWRIIRNPTETTTKDVVTAYSDC